MNEDTVSTNDSSVGCSEERPEEAVVNNTSTSLPVAGWSGVGPAVTPSARSVRHSAVARRFILRGFSSGMNWNVLCSSLRLMILTGNVCRG